MADDNGAPHACRRRTVLKTLGTAGSAVTLSLAGCLGAEDGATAVTVTTGVTGATAAATVTTGVTATAAATGATAAR